MRAQLLQTGIATAVFLALAAPAWPCGPPDGGPMNGNNAGQSSSNNNNGGRGSWDNAGGENARQGASDQANRDLNGDNSGGPRRSSDNSGNNDQSANYSNQIGALGAAQAADDGMNCQQIKAELDRLTSETQDAGRDSAREALYYGRTMQMTPAMISNEIAAERARLDKKGSDWIDKPGSIKLDFLNDLLAAKLGGLPEALDGMQRRAAQEIQLQKDAAFRLRANQQRRIEDLQNRLSNNNCNGVAASPSPSPSPGNQ